VLGQRATRGELKPDGIVVRDGRRKKFYLNRPRALAAGLGQSGRHAPRLSSCPVPRTDTETGSVDTACPGEGPGAAARYAIRLQLTRPGRAALDRASSRPVNGR
jgi:hypothetical protein